MIDRLRQNLRFAIRTLVRNPAFVLVAVGTIAVGVGANAAIFSVVNAVLLRPLPFPRSGELVLVSMANRQTRQTFNNTTPANFLDWRIRNRSFTGLAAFREVTVTFLSGDHPERLTGAMVTGNFFDVLEVRPALGRGFTAEDERRGSGRSAILSDAFWRERFGGRPDVVGQRVRFDDELYTIVGVAPRGVDYPEKAQLWIPSHFAVPDDPLLPPSQDPSTDRSHGYFFALGRLKRGVTFDTATTDMDSVAASLERDFPADNRNVGIALTRLRDDLVGNDVRSTALLLFAAVGVLLMIAAANVSGLLMARATARHQEIALRAALGATRRQIVAQLLIESAVLAAFGGAAGVLLAMWLVPALVRLSPTDLTVVGDVIVDRSVLLFGLGISIVTGVLFGLIPARQLTRLDVSEDLKQSPRGAAPTPQRRLRGALVAGEIALSLVLLVAAGLTIRSFIRVQNVPPGFNPEGVLTVTVSPPANRYGTQSKRAELWERLLHAVRAIPGAQAAGAVSRLPLLSGNSVRGLAIPGIAAESQPSADYRTCTPDYFRVMGISILRGRDFDDRDRENRPFVAIVSSAAAGQFWPRQDPIGKHFQIEVPGPEHTIVGVVGDVRSASLESVPRPTIYTPYRQDAFPFMTFVVKSSIDPRVLGNQIRSAVWSVDRDQPVGGILTMDERLSQSLARRRFGVSLLSAFGTIAMLLATVGLYGVLAFVVSQRRREIGVRIALGATPRAIVSDVLGEGLQLAGIGVAVGVALAIAATRLMSALLFGTSPTDVATFVSAALLLSATAVAASLAPALRASKVDPLVALRDE